MKNHQIFGALVFLSSALIAVPQLLGFLYFTLTHGYSLNIFDDIAYYGGIFNGSLAIPRYEEYYELGFIGFGLIVFNFLGMKFGYDLMKSKISAYKGVIFVACGLIVLFVTLMIEATFKELLFAIVPLTLQIIFSFGGIMFAGSKNNQ